ncbi:MAG: NADH-quinone oxidoreductase subunit NuoE [Desulfovibrio sp.]|nr:NADH-quinone oxidoreductase subunit NuoE [Desulfovibrio sp.]
MACDCKGTGAFDLAPLKEVLDAYKGTKGALIPVLQKAQNIYGYLPKQVIEAIAEGLNIPVAEVFGVVTFYAQFHLNPRGKNIVRVCQGTACHVRGGAKILQAVCDHLKVKPGETTPDLNFTIETVACLGACGLAPVMMVNDETHGRLTPGAVGAILDSYVAK